MKILALWARIAYYRWQKQMPSCVVGWVTTTGKGDFQEH